MQDIAQNVQEWKERICQIMMDEITWEGNESPENELGFRKAFGRSERIDWLLALSDQLKDVRVFSHSILMIESNNFPAICF